MVKDAGAHHVIEPLAELTDLLDREPVQLEVGDLMTRGERPRVSRLSALTSIPTTRTSGRRSACRTAWEVPQPATSTDPTESRGRSGQIAWWAAQVPRADVRSSVTGGG
jgi:hypothetical protein